MELKEWLPLWIAGLGIILNGLVLFMQRRHSHRLETITTSYKAEVDLSRSIRETIIKSQRSTEERKIADIHDAIVKAQCVKDALSSLIEASHHPDMFPRAATIRELEDAAGAMESAHSNLTKWFSLPEMLQVHKCKSECATLSAIIGTHISETERIAVIPISLLEEINHCRDTATNAQAKLRELVQSSQYLLEVSYVAPRSLG